jgi:biopolymer transport protein ExbD
VSDPRSVIAVDALGNITLDSLKVPEGLLESYLAAYQKQNPGRKLELEADRKLALERLLYVWDALTKAGIPVKDVPARIKLPADKPGD